MKRVVRVWKSAQGCIGCRLVRRNSKSMPLHFSSELLRSPMYPSGWLLANSAGQLSSPGTSFVTNSSATNSGRYGRYDGMDMIWWSDNARHSQYDMCVSRCLTQRSHILDPNQFSCSSDLHATCCLCVPTSMEGEWKLALSLHSSEMTRRDDTAQWHRQVTIGRQNCVDTVCLNIY